MPRRLPGWRGICYAPGMRDKPTKTPRASNERDHARRHARGLWSEGSRSVPAGKGGWRGQRAGIRESVAHVAPGTMFAGGA
jgi:hypothetical protein